MTFQRKTSAKVVSNSYVCKQALCVSLWLKDSCSKNFCQPITFRRYTFTFFCIIKRTYSNTLWKHLWLECTAKYNSGVELLLIFSCSLKMNCSSVSPWAVTTSEKQAILLFSIHTDKYNSQTQCRWVMCDICKKSNENQWWLMLICNVNLHSLQCKLVAANICMYS